MQGRSSIEGQAMSRTENSWSTGITMPDSTGLESRPPDATFRSSRLGPTSRVATICQVLHSLNMGALRCWPLAWPGNFGNSIVSCSSAWTSWVLWVRSYATRAFLYVSWIGNLA